MNSSELFETPRYRIAGDQGLLMEFGNIISPIVNRKVRAVSALLEKELPRGVRELIPTYRLLMIRYNPWQTKPAELQQTLDKLEADWETIELPPAKVVEIPVCYGGELGPDIEIVAQTNQISQAEVVRLHTSVDYPIYMIGFTPGYPFMGGLPEKLFAPRRKTPRTHVPKGSVAVANNQTGIYPVASPGGWQIIGRTPMRLFAPEREKPFLYDVGDKIRFRAIERDTFEKMAAQQEIGG